MASLDVEKTRREMEKFWEGPMLELMSDFIKIPNLSPNFDPEVHTNGHQEKAMALFVAAYKAAMPKNGTLKTFECKKKSGDAEDRTPLIVVDVPASSPTQKGTILMYNHGDKQPWMLPWTPGCGGPVEPKLVAEHKGIKGPLLFGRGAADDGYGGPASLAALNALQQQGVEHCRVVLITEFSEESGSCDLPFWMAHKDVAPIIGTPDLVVCLDAGALCYTTMYTCMSLRGVLIADINVETMNQSSIHSGIGSGVCPDPNRLIRMLLNRIEDVDTGKVKLASLNVKPKEEIIKLLAPINDMDRAEFMKSFPVIDSLQIPGKNNVETLSATTWDATVTVVGYGSSEDAADRLPPVPQAGNVVRGSASVRLSIRLPPGADADAAAKEFVKVIEAEPRPLGAKVSAKVVGSMAGWIAPPTPAWLHDAMNTASNDAFGKNYGAVCVGGGIPLMGMLTEQFPKSAFVITGVLGPESNAHAPDEFLHMGYGAKINLAIARILELSSKALNKQ